MSEKKEIRATVDGKTAAFIAKYADKYELGVGEAIDKLINTAMSRLAALARYAKNNKAEPKPKPPKPKKEPKVRAKKPAKVKAEGAPKKKATKAKKKQAAADAPAQEEATTT